MQPDYPAAHSMDTYWFAVDSEGKIGFFETGEPGPVPAGARSDQSACEWLKYLFFAAPNLLLLNARSKTSVHAHEFTEVGDGAMFPHMEVSLCMLLRSKEHVSQLGEDVEVGPEIVTPDGNIFPVYVHGTNDREFQAIHKAGKCLGCVGLWWPSENCGERLGIFPFDTRGNYHYGPYARTGVPNKPLLLSQLPDEVQKLIAAFPLPIRFDNEQYVQPLELVPCSTWGTGDYLASDMKTIRPMPEHK